MKRCMFGLFVAAVMTVGPSASFAADPAAMPGGVLYGPATAGYTYLANVYPSQWRFAKLSAAHTYRVGVARRSDIFAARQSSSPEYRALRRLGVVAHPLYSSGRHHTNFIY